jgi:alpha-L-fucosidase 2
MMTDAFTTLRYGRPAERWTDALPIGNGRLGAMCFGGVERDRFQLNDATCWTGSPATTRDPVSGGPDILRAARAALADGDVRAAEESLARLQGGNSQAYQPLADLWLEHRLRSPSTDGYQRSLDLRTAVASHTHHSASARVSQEAWISAPAQALVIRRRVQQAYDIPLLVGLDSPHPGATASPAPGGLDLVVRMPVLQGHPAVPSAVDAGVTALVGVRVLAAGVMTVVDGRLRVDDAAEVILILSAVTDYADPFTDPHGDVGALRRALDDRLGALATSLVREGGYPALRAAHERDHSALFTRVGLRLGPADPAVRLDTSARVQDPGPALAALQFQYGRYLMIAGSRPGSPPLNLQGIWNDQLRPPWNGNYTTNLNLEMNYWPAEVTNLSECHRPLLDWLKHAARRGTSTARDRYGADGWTLHHNSDAWCFSLPSGVGGDDVCWSFWPLAGAWLSSHIWEYYDFTGDRTYLESEGWPLLRSAAAFCLDWLVPVGRALGTSPATSPENHYLAEDGKPAAATVSTTADLVLIRSLLANLIRLAPAAGSGDDDILDRARHALDRLPAERIGHDGRLAEWAYDVADAEPEHRHTSHLIGVYPGHTVDPDTTPDLAAAARRALDARGPESTGWSLAWRIALRARLRDAEGAHDLVRRFLRPTGGERSGIYTNLFCAHPPFQIDGNFGFTAGVAEMLLQSQSSTAEQTHLHLLPALPSAWSEGAFAGLRARGGVTVDATWTGGTVQSLRLLSDTARPVSIRAGSQRHTVHLEAGRPRHLTFDS